MMKNTTEERPTPQIKVCGFTRVEEAGRCAELGVDAIGCVFFPPSPRNVTEERAGEISRAVSSRLTVVGVFVNETFSKIMRKVERCNLSAVQLHGKETPELAARLRAERLIVVKALFINGAPSLERAPDYPDAAFLVECAKGPLPGGNAMAWRWDTAKEFGAGRPLVLAGGLSPGNIQDAILDASPDAVDVSSGVESAPGRKDPEKIKAFVERVRAARVVKKEWKNVFRL